MPVHGMDVGEGPGNPAEAKTAGYSGVFIDVARIIVVDEIVPQRLTKNDPGKRYETNANAHTSPLAAPSVAEAWLTAMVHGWR